MAVLFYSIWEINEIIVTAATIPYAGAEDDAALNAGVERIKGDARAQSHARRFYQTTGRLRRPVVTLQNAFQHELNYSELVPEGMPLRSSPKYHGHCDFTTSEILDAFGKMIKVAIGHKGYEIVPANSRWVETYWIWIAAIAELNNRWDWQMSL